MGRTGLWISLVLLAGMAAAGWFAWHVGFGRRPPLDGPLGSLQQHLAREGIPTRAVLVRPGGGPQQKAAFELEDADERRFYVGRYLSPKLAQSEYEGWLRMGPRNHPAPQVRGELLMYMTDDWPVDDPDAKRVIAAFHRWPITSAP